jgi:hypothetical protein
MGIVHNQGRSGSEELLYPQTTRAVRMRIASLLQMTKRTRRGATTKGPILL